jgi:putative Holliday junction resolvase
VKPILGIDFGKVRIGLAISDDLRLLAHPLKTIAADKYALEKIAQVVRQRKAERVVVGIPKTMSGETGKAAAEVLRFVERLRMILPCEVVTWDERLTTVSAERILREAGRSSRGNRKIIDQLAAQMILQGYLDRQAETSSAPTFPR